MDKKDKLKEILSEIKRLENMVLNIIEEENKLKEIDYISATELTNALCLSSKGTISNWIRKGLIKDKKQKGKGCSLMIKCSEIDELVGLEQPLHKYYNSWINYKITKNN
ncbi:MAG: hypothetical protein PHX04_06250 [Bacilli bacterium]|nr:hypothetical protein [Bacilli bacterium]